MSNESDRPMRRVKRLHPLDLLEKPTNMNKSTEVVRWTQNRTLVTNGDITIVVGSPITGYCSNGIFDWYVLGAKNGKLLITTKNFPTTVTLSGRDGYTNGIAILNEEASKFTNSIYADGNARTIDVEDINRVTGYNPETAGFGTNKIWQYGNEVTYYWNGTKRPCYSAGNGWTGIMGEHYLGFYYPTVNGWTRSPRSTTAILENKEKITTLTNTCYDYEGNLLIDSSSEAYRLLFDSGDYLLGSQFICCGCNYVSFGLRSVVNKGVRFFHYKSLALSICNGYDYTLNVRTVVSLKSDIKIDSDGNISK